MNRVANACKTAMLLAWTLLLVFFTLLCLIRANPGWLNGQGTLETKELSKVDASLNHLSRSNTSSFQDERTGVANYAETQPTSGFDPTTSYSVGVDFLFWLGKNKICDFIRNITGVSILGTEEPDYLGEERHPPLVNLTLQCEDLGSNTGNWITAIYHLRLVAALGRVDFQFQCETGMDSAEVSILPWLSGRFPAPLSSDWPYDYGWPDPDRVCSEVYAKLPLHHLAHEMRHDMRRMAVTILGPRDFNSSDLKHSYGELQEALRRRPPSSITYPRTDLEIDDAAIHFRCGDVFGETKKDVYGLIKFREYVERIPNETTRSIGIHTQSFNISLLREADQDTVHDCEKVVHILVMYLQRVYPNATISIRNTMDDTIPISYARMTMAAQTITSMSTFGIFPAIGSFGDGYFQKSGRQNRFAHELPRVLPNFHIMDGPILSSPSIRKSQWKDIVKFLTEG